MSKKKDSKGKKKATVEEDESTAQIIRFYRKKLEQMGTPLCKTFREKVEEAIENLEHLESVILNIINYPDHPLRGSKIRRNTCNNNIKINVYIVFFISHFFFFCFFFFFIYSLFSSQLCAPL